MSGYTASVDTYVAPGKWAARMACASAPPMVDQIPSGKGFKPNAPGVEICERCPVRQQCLDWAMSQECDPTPGMILGGLFTFERERVRYA